MITPLGQRLIERGVVQGRELQSRDFVLRSLIKRFGPVPPTISEQLDKIDDLQRLDALWDRAMSVADLQEFVQALEEG